MNRQQAMNCLNEGNKVSHSYFTESEYVYIDEYGNFKCADGFLDWEEFWLIRSAPHWDKGWYIKSDK